MIDILLEYDYFEQMFTLIHAVFIANRATPMMAFHGVGSIYIYVTYMYTLYT